MGMAEDIAQIKWAVSQLGDAAGLSEAIKALEVESRDVLNKIRYDIEPKLDKALEGKTGEAVEAKKSPDDMLRAIRYAILYATAERKIEAVKELRKITNAGIAEAKATAEWITSRIDQMVQEQKKKEAE